MLFTSGPIQVCTDVWLLSGFVETSSLLKEIANITAQAPLRRMQVGRGKTMSVAMSNCGELGWTSSNNGYAYTSIDPASAQPWPAMPALFLSIAAQAAHAVAWAPFLPDACLVNHYVNGASMGMHQDTDEADLTQPIVSISIGASCKFILGGLTRQAPTRSIELTNGDVIIWGKSARLLFHGVRPLAKDQERYNLTLRKAG
jgi:DNA oxidative demethylase